MPEHSTAADEILDMVKAHPGCTLDESTHYLKKSNWCEVFIEVDHLSRIGRLRLTRSGTGFIRYSTFRRSGRVRGA